MGSRESADTEGMRWDLFVLPALLLVGCGKAPVDLPSTLCLSANGSGGTDCAGSHGAATATLSCGKSVALSVGGNACENPLQISIIRNYYSDGATIQHCYSNFGTAACSGSAGLDYSYPCHYLSGSQTATLSGSYGFTAADCVPAVSP